jgi:hypothetical protein
MEWNRYQINIFDAYENTRKNLFIKATAGCFGKDTEVLMYDGSLKKIQDIQVGDLVMGPDSKPRRVLEVNSGRSMLYKVKPVKGETWVCNDSHIFTVWDDDIANRIKRYRNSKWKTPFQDYSFETILKRRRKDGSIRQMQLQRAAVAFEEKQVPVDPYFLGLWLAEGSKNLECLRLSINSKDSELFSFLHSLEGEGYLVQCKKEIGESHRVNISFPEWHENPLLSKARAIWQSKDFDSYKFNSLENRLQLLAGLLDGDGCLQGTFSITTKYKELNDLILFLCRSCGLAAYSSYKKGIIKDIGFEGMYYKISISGNLEIIPNKLLRKKAVPRKQIKSVLRTGFSISEIGEGQWFGFLCDGDHRFLLSDFTIVHNSSKTTCMLECVKRTSQFKTKIFLAFNKSISDELQSRVPERTEAVTFHSKGLKVLLRNFRMRFKVSENKTFAICKQILDLSEIPPKQQIRYMFELQEIWNQIRVNLLVDYPKDIPLICIEKDIDFRDRMIEDIRMIEKEWISRNRSIQRGEFVMDFTDMLWLPYTMVSEEDYPKYDVVFIDEGQDLNVLQREFALRLKAKYGRFIIVGDEFQCQPSGTKVLMSDGTKKNIEDLYVGDSLVSYEYRHDNCFIGNYERIKEKSLEQYQKLCDNSKSKVLQIEERNYRGELFVLTTGDMVSKYSPNHICYVRWKPEIKTKYVLYLMQKGNWFRIGITPYAMGKTKHSGGLLFRFRCEEADNLWILNLYDDKAQARSDEMFFSYKYGIPQTIFICREQNDTILGQEGVNKFFDRFESSLYEKANQLLNLFGRKFECPFLTKEKGESRWRTGISYMFNTYACNIFPELMQVIIYDGFNYSKTSKGTRAKPIYKDIDKWEKIFYEGKLYSLAVGWNQNYVADGILTHNCIYGFQGSSLDNFWVFQREPNTTVLPLSITYRCARRIVEEAKTVFPGEIEAAPDAIEGIVRRGNLEEAESGDFVLCRNNIPLVEAFIFFLKKKKKAVIKGKDFGEALLYVLDRASDVKSLDLLLEEKLKNLQERGIPRAAALNHPSYVSLEEKCIIIKTLYGVYGSMVTLYSVMSEIFTDNVQEGIILSTCHKSKGLEADRVFFLNPELIPHPKAKTEKALYGEKCLKFVAITRAKKELVYCNI